MPFDESTGLITSSHSDVEIPDEFVHEYILRHLMKDFQPDRIHETEDFTGKTTSGQELLDTYKRVSQWLHKKGVGAGDRVAFYCRSFLEFTPTVLAVWRVGAACTYIRHEMIVDKEYRTSVGIPKIVFASEEKLEELLSAGYDGIVVYRCKQVPDGCTSFDELLKEPAEDIDFKISGTPSEHLAVLTFTGGTTGNPKAIQTTHRNLISVLAFDQKDGILTLGSKVENPITLSPFPTNHLAGIVIRPCASTLNVHSIVVEPPLMAPRLCELIQKYKVNRMTGIPTSLVALTRFDGRKDYDLSSLTACLAVGTPLLAEMHKEITTTLGVKLYSRLAMSECGGAVTCASEVPGSVGCLCPNTQGKLINIKDNSVITKPHQIGELYIRGPQLTKGYYNQPAKNAEAFDSEGFLKTGDLVTVDSDGNLYYFDRVQESIEHPSGKLISSTELEISIGYFNSNILEVAVVPSKNGPWAFVVPMKWPENEDVFCQEVLKKTNGILTEEYKHLAGVSLRKREEIPRTVLGKPLKRKLQLE